MSFKQADFSHDAQFTYVRLSKGRNLKEHRSDFILCEYQTRPDVDLTEWDIQQVRAVYKRDEWRLQFVCRTTSDPEPPGDDVGGVDLGICNFAAVSFGSESVLYPGGALKENEYYFIKKKANCDDSLSREATRLDRKRTGRRTHLLHALSKAIMKECVERSVGDLGGIREDDETGESRNWGDHDHRNLDLHGWAWAFDRFRTPLDYKAEAEGIDVELVSERDTSKSCSACGHTDDTQRVERGLYVCEECDTVANADVNGAENIRQKVLPSLATDGGERDNG
ncbi:MAG: transposase, IS605 OrfB family, central region [Haloquadratum walsbyi J07HQW2]|uniref:Transposase, IS605 OrfB family, central region n=1 Tax=Haloquadratum walsbyi J07HQW2 TaxID=1238425 RepID=U1PXI2_9EURY|nr:MAG: transposase, IS605 OrfB family, central region [Haloquadratum walsbyi J07HQW2]